MSSLPELELSQLPAGSSAGEGVDHQGEVVEDLGSPAAATTDKLEPETSQLAGSSAGDTADMTAPETSQLAGSSAGEGVERQEDDDDVPLPPIPAAEIRQLAREIQEDDDDVPLPAAAVPPIPAAGELRQRAREIQEVEGDEILEANRNRVSVTMDDNLFARAFHVPNPMAVRYVYALLFALMTIVAWVMRDIELSRFDHSGCDGAHDCIAADGVLRGSMALAIFFFIMFVTTVNTRNRYEMRNLWHCHWWAQKTAIFVIGCGLALYAPSSLIQFYGTVARVGAWLFLVIQFFSMTNFIMWVNEWCPVESNRQRWAHMTYGLLPLSMAPVVLYLGSFLGLAFMYYWYAAYWKPTKVIYISVTMSIICLMFLISCVHRVSGGYLAPGLMMAYVVFMCWTTIRSEPHMDASNKKTKSTTDWQNILSLVIGAAVIIASTYTVGNDSKCIQFSSTTELADDVPYGYGFFHLVFALGAMYIGMLFVGWDAHRSIEKWTVDFGWASTKVRATSGLLVAISYVLMLASQELWNLMLAVTSNSTPAANEARRVGAPVVPLA